MEEQRQSEKQPSGIAGMLSGRELSFKLISIFSDKLLYWILLGAAFLLPIFFIPGGAVGPELAKLMFLEILVFISLVVWGVSRLRSGVIEVPKSWLLVVSLLLVVQFVAAAIMSPAPIVSFIGSGYDLGTVNSFTILFLLMFLSSVVFNNRDRVLSLCVALMLSGTLLMLYHLLRHFFGPDFLDFGAFTSSVMTPVGKWNDFATLVGAVMILVLSTLYFFPQNKILRFPAYALFILGLLFLLLIDFTVLWIILFVMMGIFAAFTIFEGEQAHRKAHENTHGKPLYKRVVGHLPGFAALLLFVAIVYGSGLASIPWGENKPSISNVVSKGLNSSLYSEVVLTPKLTFEIVTNTIKESPFFGTGPNRFSSSYLKYKTDDINQTPFWDSTFDYGLGHIPTFFGTTGLIGMLLWIVFIVFLFLKTRKVFALFSKDRIAAFLSFSLFLMTLYFWSIAFFYLPNAAIFALAFLFTGALIGFLVHEGVLDLWKLKFASNSRLSFLVTPLIIVVLVGVVASGVLLYRQFYSLVAFRDAQLAVTSGNMVDAQIALTRANELFERDVYHRGLSGVALVNLESLARETKEDTEIANRANQYISDARTHAERAVALDPTNFENHLQFGSVYDTLGLLGVQNASPFAREHYEQALRLNPKSPRVLFVLSKLELSSGDREKAKQYLYQALAERPNFLEALSFITQLELQEENQEAAVLALERGLAVEPSNFLMHFSLGYLYYVDKNYKAAVPELEAAVMLNPVYANAKYFLGLSYAEIGRRDDAIAQFNDVQMLNPENQEVARILRNLKAGRDPLQTVAPAPDEN